MKTYSFARIRGIFFISTVITVLLVGLIKECTTQDDGIREPDTFHRDDHR